jgi:hypothetical protein
MKKVFRHNCLLLAGKLTVQVPKSGETLFFLDDNELATWCEQTVGLYKEKLCCSRL